MDYVVQKDKGVREILTGNEHTQRDLVIQLILSIVFGTSAFLAFCLLRPRWTSLYSARKKRKSEAASLPTLPKSLFGWIPVVWRITEDEVLATAGLDAFVFLGFFKMAIKYIAFLLFFALTVMYPVYMHHKKDDDTDPADGGDGSEFPYPQMDLRRRGFFGMADNSTGAVPPWEEYSDYLWVYVIFVYLFTGMGIYLVVRETHRMIQVRQKYLAAQSSISDRTIRLSGIPEDLRSEAKIKDTIENLEIGKVESVTLCRNWNELDDLVKEREQVLRRLEEAWTIYLGTGKASRKMKRRFSAGENGTGGDEEQAGLLSGDDMDDGAHVLAYNKPRPEKRIWYGFMSLQSRKVDAIDYYEEKLRRLDERVKIARKKEYPATPLAFVTLDSIAACQMACQAIIDAQPMQLVANQAPAPSGVVWRNTYLPRRNRMVRAWSVTAFVFLLTIFWSFLLLPLAGIQTLPNIRAVAPELADWLEDHKNIQSLIRTGVPTLLLSILNVLVPYFYEYLSYLQGMISVSDLEMSLISKNFFFTFFNLFIVFTVLGTAGRARALFDEIDAHLRDITKIAWSLAQGLESMTNFYLNYIVLQTFGLFPFRLLQFGSVSLYPLYRLVAKTPRDYSELAQPATFTYGFFIPQTLFIFIICIVYSVLRETEKVQLFGLIYFGLGAFIYKYQLLYAMDHRQFSTGRAWPMMCTRFLVGLIIFQLVMAGQLALKKAFIRSALVAPLIIGTIWFVVWYRKTYEPLMKNIALRTLREVHETRIVESIMSGSDDAGAERHDDRSRDSGTELRFVNPSLVRPLEEPWIARTAERDAEVNAGGQGHSGHSGHSGRNGDGGGDEA